MMTSQYTLPFSSVILSSAERSIAIAYLEKYVKLSRLQSKASILRSTQKKKKKSNGDECIDLENNNKETLGIQDPLDIYTLKVILTWLRYATEGEKIVYFSLDRAHLPGIQKELLRIYEVTMEERDWHHEKDVECWCLFDCPDCENENSDCATSALRPLDCAVKTKRGAWNANKRVSCDSMADSGYSGLDCGYSSPLSCITNSPPRLFLEKPAKNVVNKKRCNTRTMKQIMHDYHDITPQRKDIESKSMENRMMKKMQRSNKARTSNKAKAKRQTKLTPVHKGGEELNKLKFTSRSGRVTRRFALNTNKC